MTQEPKPANWPDDLTPADLGLAARPVLPLSPEVVPE